MSDEQHAPHRKAIKRVRLDNPDGAQKIDRALQDLEASQQRRREVRQPYDAKLAQLKAEHEMRVDALNKEYADQIGSVEAEVSEREDTVRELFLKAYPLEEAATALTLPHGSVKVVVNPEKYEVTDENALYRWSKRRRNYLNRISTLRRMVSINNLKALLDEFPVLRSSIEGVEVSRGRNLVIETKAVPGGANTFELESVKIPIDDETLLKPKASRKAR